MELPVERIGDLGVGDGHFPKQALQILTPLRIPRGVESLTKLLVDERIDTTDEEASDARHTGEVASRRSEPLETIHISLGHRLIGLDREKQRDVDVDALGGELPDRGHTLGSRGDLDHHVRPADGLVQAAGFLERTFGVVG